MKHTANILLVEDDPNFGSVLKDFLGLQNFKVEWANDGAKGWSKYNQENYDLVILDVMMPEIDGFTLANMIIDQKPEQAILFLTARNQREDIINGFKLGANDYVTKPFDSEVLIYRIMVSIKKSQAESLNQTQGPIEFAGFKLDSDSRTLKHDGKEDKLSPKECDLLHLLAQNPNKVIEKDWILKTLWKEDSYFTARSMDVYLTRIRKLLASNPGIKLETIHGKGYKLIIPE